MAASLTLTLKVKQGGFFSAYRGDEHDLLVSFTFS